jgi:predicted enzyme related to lactoylglutathione lyase
MDRRHDEDVGVVGPYMRHTVNEVHGSVRYAHTNLVARDWRRLARFYAFSFGCEPVGPERDQSGEWLESATGVPGAHRQGAHLSLPGHGDSGPTLEIFTYEHLVEGQMPVANGVGFGHIAFQVDDVAGALRRVLDNGGQRLGSISRTTVSGVGELEHGDVELGDHCPELRERLAGPEGGRHLNCEVAPGPTRAPGIARAAGSTWAAWPQHGV